MEIRPVGVKMFQADRRTDMTNLTAAFRNFADVLRIRCCENVLEEEEEEELILRRTYNKWVNERASRKIRTKFTKID